eukprot:SAG31_NODE_19314_length_606_cov_1.063116_1_plen_171_part_10
MRVVQQALREEGIHCLLYLDDGLVVTETPDLLLQQRETLERVLAYFGLQRQETKGQWEPTQDLEHLGYGVNLKKGLFYVTTERRARLTRMARSILQSAARHRRRVGARWLAEFCGLAMSTHLAVAQCRHRLRDLFDCMRAAGVYYHGWGVPVTLKHAALENLRWWIRHMKP